VLSDLIRLECRARREASHIFGRARAEPIVVNAHRVNQGEMPIMSSTSPASDFFFIEKGEPEEILATIKTLIQERIRASSAFTHPRHPGAQSMHKGLLGAATLNAELQAL